MVLPFWRFLVSGRLPGVYDATRDADALID